MSLWSLQLWVSGADLMWPARLWEKGNGRSRPLMAIIVKWPNRLVRIRPTISQTSCNPENWRRWHCLQSVPGRRVDASPTIIFLVPVFVRRQIISPGFACFSAAPVCSNWAANSFLCVWAKPKHRLEIKSDAANWFTSVMLPKIYCARCEATLWNRLCSAGTFM